MYKYKSFEVKNYRCFDHLRVSELERVNLIAGRNNVGKTALLEALFLHCGSYKPQLTMNISALRGIESLKFEFGRWQETPWAAFFKNFDTTGKIELSAECAGAVRPTVRLRLLRDLHELAKFSRALKQDQKGALAPTGSAEVAQVLELEYEEKGRRSKYRMIADEKGVRTDPITPAPPFPTFFHAARARPALKEEAERYGHLQLRGEQEIVLRALQQLEPRLRALEIAVVNGEPILHGDIGLGRLMPIPLMGEGMVRLASVVAYIGTARNGVVLLDEIENGLHHSILGRVWGIIGEAARHFDTQVFATTHSRECIQAAHKAFSDSGTYDFRLHRLEWVDGEIRAITYDKQTLSAAIETALEVR